ncbi:MAG: hypothetical protein HY011_12795 [Acidobacteria bacterium]|nr:hypothetical protein [Acidobacteriota bacterium]
MLNHNSVFRFVIVLVVSLCACAIDTLACSCADPRPPCEVFSHSSAVFIGRFVKGSKKHEYKYQDQLSISYSGEVTFDVLESFAGDLEKQINMFSGVGCCDEITFREGETYLIYAGAGDKGKLNALYRTRSVTPSQYNDIETDLEFLRNLPPKGSGAKIYGSVVANDTKLVGPKPIGKKERVDTSLRTPLSDVTISIKGEQKTLEVKTDDEGKYEVRGLKLGKYHVTVMVPEGYLKPHENWTPTQEVQVRDCGCGSADYWFYSNGRVGGRVFDQQGFPVKDAQVQVILAEWRDHEIKEGEISYSEKRSDVTNDQGDYEIGPLPPGRYLLGVSLSSASPTTPYQRTFYPGVQDAKYALEILVGLGQKLGPYNFHLKPDYETFSIQGKVLVLFTAQK